MLNVQYSRLVHLNNSVSEIHLKDATKVMMTPNCLHFLCIADYYNQIGVNYFHLINLIMIIITTTMIRPALIRVFCSSTCRGQRMVGLTDKHVCYSHLTSHALAATALRKYSSFTSNIFVQTMLKHISLSCQTHLLLTLLFT